MKVRLRYKSSLENFGYQKDLKRYNLNCTNLHDRPKYHRCLKLCPSHPTWWRTSNTLSYINFQAHTIYIGIHCRQYLELVQFWSFKSFLFTFFFSYALSICTGILGIFDIRQFEISSLIFFLVWTGKKFQFEISS